MIRVNNLDESIAFYQNVFKLNVLKKEDNESYRLYISLSRVWQ